MKAFVNTVNGTISVDIIPCDAPFSEKELSKLTEKFNNDATAIEFTGGTTYCINYKGKFRSYRLKSSSLDELFEMYKCAWKGKGIPLRKCYFIQTN